MAINQPLSRIWPPGHESYRIQRYNAIYTAITNRKHICDFLLVIKSNLLLSCTVSKIRLIIIVKFSLATGGRCIITPLLGMIPCEYRNK